MAEKRQIHVSGMTQHAACGVQFERRHIRGEKLPPAAAMVVGTAVDAAVTTNLQAKIDTGELLSVEQVSDIARDRLHREWSLSEIILGEGDSLDQSVDKSTALAELHARRLAPTIEPTHVDRRVTLELPGYDFELTGAIDIQTDEKIRDTKTGRAAPQQSQADTSLQLTMYDLFRQTADGETTGRVGLDVLWQTPAKKQNNLRVIDSRRTAADHQALLERAAVMNRSIEAGIFVPANPDDWRCSPDWCGYFHTCPYARKPVSVAVPDLSKDSRPEHQERGNINDGTTYSSR